LTDTKSAQNAKTEQNAMLALLTIKPPQKARLHPKPHNRIRSGFMPE
jgi:hypothetical protein